ncbi:MAG: hypothetical protein Kow00128_01120 [Deltaproteobacteria bacterium]
MERTRETALRVPRIAFLLPLLAALSIALTASAWASAVDVRVVSDRKGVLPLYPVGADGERGTYRAYLEAERGERYGIRIANRTNRRIGVVIAVDGRNIISGKKSYLRNHERMYILGPYESAVYDGWRTAQDVVNRFYFTEPGDSYAAAFGDRSAMGVIAVAVYREKQVPPRRTWRDRDSGGTAGEDRSMADEPAPAAPGKAGRKRFAPEAKEEAGTGFGEESHSPSIRVHFEPERRAAERHFLKYEWRDTLCRKGILDCRYSRNRFWDDDEEYAPYPPGRRPGCCE